MAPLQGRCNNAIIGGDWRKRAEITVVSFFSLIVGNTSPLQSDELKMIKKST